MQILDPDVHGIFELSWLRWLRRLTGVEGLFAYRRADWGTWSLAWRYGRWFKDLKAIPFDREGPHLTDEFADWARTFFLRPFSARENQEQLWREEAQKKERWMQMIYEEREDMARLRKISRGKAEDLPAANPGPRLWATNKAGTER